MKSIRFLPSLLFLSALGAFEACLEFGAVDQGRVVAFDPAKGTCTLIRDTAPVGEKPSYRGLPPVVYEMPDSHTEIGAEPKAGRLMRVDEQAHTLEIYDTASAGFRAVSYTPVETLEGIDKKDPRVYDAAQQAQKSFPVIDHSAGTVQLYLSAQKRLLTMALPAEALALPDDTWRMGDEVRVYYKGKKAQRFMNVSRTDIYKK